MHSGFKIGGNNQNKTGILHFSKWDYFLREVIKKMNKKISSLSRKNGLPFFIVSSFGKNYVE